MNIKNKVELFLDSGAFSAWSQGEKININDYISFIKEHEDIISVYANLDVIGNAEATWKNQRRMEKTGLTPLPVFHYGEDEKWLQKYMGTGHKYIGLGGMVPISTRDLKYWLDQIFSKYLVNENGMPKIKIHGFGLTSLVLMLRYPWYSVDSTSWVITGRLGSVYIPQYRGNKWVYDENSWKIAVSSRSPASKDAGKHVSTLNPMEKKILLKYIKEKGYHLGKSEFVRTSQTHVLKDNERWVEKLPKDKKQKRLLEVIKEPGVSNVYQLRDELNIIYFMDLEKSMPKWPWPFTRKAKGFKL